MITPIKTNQLSVTLYEKAFDEKYDLFRVETTDKYFKHGAYTMDAPLLCNNVVSVFFESGKAFYVLMRKAASNKNALISVFSATENAEKITIFPMMVDEADHRVVVSLLLNALGSYELDCLRFNNLTGHLYCFHPKWLKKSTRNNESVVLKIPCLELSVTRELRLTMAVRTFTSERLKRQIVFTKRPFEQYPQYVLSASNTLRRKLASDTQKSFILRQTKGDKTEIPFLDIQNKDKFEATKMGVLTNVLEHFNKKYAGICSLALQEVEGYTSLDWSRSVAKENRIAVKNLVSENPIRIIDMIGDQYSAIFCEDIQFILQKKFGIQSSIGKRVSKGHLNICLIHEAAYYDGVNDPHDKIYDGIAVQHITLENFAGLANIAISAVIHELLIKKDIQSRQITLFDWPSLGITDDISFGIRKTIQDVDRYFFMKVSPNGAIDFFEQTLNMFEMNEYADCMNIFAESKDVVGAIRYANGDINVIRETDWITIPEIEKIQESLAGGDTHLRGKDKRKELLSAVTDIKLFDNRGKTYYFVGIIGEGMRTNINRAANIRVIDIYKGDTSMFEALLPLMNVTFVRNGQLTVLPFPFKYLREYIESEVLNKTDLLNEAL